MLFLASSFPIRLSFDIERNADRVLYTEYGSNKYSNQYGEKQYQI